jgi:hypothetical protein
VKSDADYDMRDERDKLLWSRSYLARIVIVPGLDAAVDALLPRAHTSSSPHYAAAAPPILTAAHATSMAAEATEEEPRTPLRDQSQLEKVDSNGRESGEEDSDDDEDAEDEEPKLKYNRLTSNLLPLYRNGDATSTFVVAGDKMVRP